MVYHKEEIRDVVLLTGGSGFLGGHVVRMLADRADNISEIRVLDVNPLPEEILETVSPKVRLSFIEGDVRDSDILNRACRGVSAVLHMASSLDTTTEPDTAHMYSVNVIGTRNVINACLAANIEHLIYTSTSEIMRGFSARNNATEEQVDHSEIKSHSDILFPAYSLTKKEAEDQILNTNNSKLPNGRHMKTISLRPCGVYGEGDVKYVTTALKTGKSFLSILPILGSPETRMQRVYAGNVAWAHVHVLNLMRSSLATGDIWGKPYNITDGTSLSNNFIWMRPFFESQHIKVLPFAIPLWLVYYFWVLLELFAWLMSPFFRVPLACNRRELFLCCTTSYYDGSRARKILGYTPLYTAKDAFVRSYAYYSSLRL